MKKIAVLIGTRPGIIKMTPLVHELNERNIDNTVIHTGQHYSDTMNQQILVDVGLEKIDYLIKRPQNCITHAEQTAYMLVEIEKILLIEKPDILLVCGDANTNFAGALAARKIHVKVGHVEAGLRSFDWRMPEEHNRVMIDHISDYLFAPTEKSKAYLIKENVKGKIYIVGNTIVDSTLKYTKNYQFTENNNKIDTKSDYIVLTTHREENVDNQAILFNIYTAIKNISEKHKMNIVFPIHPRTKKRTDEYNLFPMLKNIKMLNIIEPLNYIQMLQLVKNAKVVMTDSGGLQEESCILDVPCLTLRDNTERPETVEVGANKIVGTNPKTIVEAFDLALLNDKHWVNPFGDGQTSKRIIDICIYGKPEEDEFIHSFSDDGLIK